MNVPNPLQSVLEKRRTKKQSYDYDVLSEKHTLSRIKKRVLHFPRFSIWTAIPIILRLW